MSDHFFILCKTNLLIFLYNNYCKGFVCINLNYEVHVKAYKRIFFKSLNLKFFLISYFIFAKKNKLHEYST